jgi:hypothetical protein
MKLKSGSQWRIGKLIFKLQAYSDDNFVQFNEYKTGRIMISMGAKAAKRFLTLASAKEVKAK